MNIFLEEKGFSILIWDNLQFAYFASMYTLYC